MKKIYKISLFASLFSMAFMLSGCGAEKNGPVPAPQKNATSPTIPETTQTKNSETEQALPKLPADDKAAIDAELKNIDSDLNSADGIEGGDDLSDAELEL